MDRIRQGDVYWVDFGEPAGSEPAFLRPCVVVCAISSNLKLEASPGNVLLKKGEAKLPKDSIVNITQMITVDKACLEEKIGSLSHVKLMKVLDGVDLLLRPTRLA